MTKIEWCDQTINPIIGCTKVSEACDNCYAEVMARRLAGMKHTKDDYSQVLTAGHWNGNIVFRVKELLKPEKWTKPQRIFITSMGDLFHENVLDQWLIEIMFMVKNNPQHTFIMLTKRPKRMLEFFTNCPTSPFMEPLPNLWMGVTIENQFQADKRIPILLKIPAAKRFISCEPLLSFIDLENIRQYNSENRHIASYQVLKPIKYFGDSNRPALDWVIAGAETGNRARIMYTSWAQLLFEQCKKANVPFFLKKISNWAGETLADKMLKEDLRQFPK
jgi:protein gp37